MKLYLAKGENRTQNFEHKQENFLHTKYVR